MALTSDASTGPVMTVSLKSLTSAGKSIAKVVFRRLPAPVQELLWTRTPAERLRQRPALRDRPQVVADLRRRLAEGPGPSIWFLPTQTWFSTHFQRPQQMARALAAAGCPVVYGEPWVGQHITSLQGQAEARFHGVKELSPRLHLLRWPPQHLRDLIAEAEPDVIMMLWPMQSDLLPEQPKSIVVYEMIDDHEVIPDADETFRANHRKWVRDADVLVATADDLLAQLKRSRPDVLLLPNAVMMEDWTNAANADLPADLAEARKAPVVVAYYGTIADWFDWALWEGAARARPDWSFVLIGPPYDGRAETVHARVSLHPNMHYLGAKPYHSLPAYVNHCDVMAIPFVLNSITHSCSPVKLFEYMAAGKPVVASPMREVLKYRSVLFAATPADFVSRVETALRQGQDAAYRQTLEREARENTWQGRAKALRHAIDSARAARKIAGAPPQKS
jgi:glycosyltransferase involved in cell wall biosynthesis